MGIYKWTFACWLNNKLSIIPRVNLVSNIGFAPDALHTSNTASRLASIPTTPIEFPLNHPPFVVRNVQADAVTQKNVYGRNALNIFIDTVKFAFRSNI